MAIESAARGRLSDRQKVERAARAAVEGSRRRASGTRTRSPCRSWRTASSRRPRANGRERSTLVRAGAGDPARPVRRAHLGIEHRAESRDLGPDVPGRAREVSRRVPALLADARSRGNLYIATELCTRSNFVWLAADDPDEGERETVESIERWSQKGFHRQHYSAHAGPCADRALSRRRRGGVATARRTAVDAAAFVDDARPGHPDRGALPARALRAGDGCRRQRLPPIPVGCPHRSPPHRQGADAMVRSDCPAAQGRDCCLEGTHAARRETTSTTPPIDSTAPT